MSKLGLIIQREYMSIVGRKSFLVMTLLVPVLMAACCALPVLLAYFNEDNGSVENVAVLDETGRFSKAIADNSNYHFVPLAANAGKTDPRQFYEKSGGSVAAVVVIPRNVMESGKVSVYSENTISPALSSHIEDCLSDTLTAAKVASYGVPGLQKMIDESRIDVSVNGVRWSDDGGEQMSSADVAVAIGFALAFLTYMFVLSYGAMIMNSVVEEKTNRIVEVVVSSCKPFQLMMGKIIGVGLVGLTQFAIWAVLLGIVGSVGGMALGVSGMMSAPDVTASAMAMGADPDLMHLVQSVLSVNYLPIVVCFVLYFVGGYLLFASLFAGFGSAVDQANDASQFMMPVMIIMIVAFYAGIACVDNPSGPMAVWCSMIPFTSSIVMMVRLPYDVPLWQLATSLVLLYGTAAAMVWLSGRIYRTGILLYGKKLTFRDIAKWVNPRNKI